MTLNLAPLSWESTVPDGAWLVLGAFALGAVVLRWAARVRRALPAPVPVRVRRR